MNLSTVSRRPSKDSQAPRRYNRRPVTRIDAGVHDLPDLEHPDNPFASEEITPACSAEWDARRRVAAAIRRLTEVLVSSTPPIPRPVKFGAT